MPRFIHAAGLTIEAKSLGQYVCGPGSVHPTGVVYSASEWPWQWTDLPFVWPARFVDEREPGEESSTRFEFPDEAREGERHDVLFRLIRSCKAQGVDINSVRRRVSLLNAGCCKPSLREDATFEQWFRRAWNLVDRPLVRAADNDPVANEL